jgi:outer membrane protein assembly factor BamA
VEYSLPVFFREVRLVALFDWGNLEPGWSHFSSGRIRTAAGLGLQLRLPLLGQVVPLNLYWTEALSSERGDREQTFAFTLGWGF